MGTSAYAISRHRVWIVAFIVLALAVAALLALEHTNTGASTVSRISTIPASSHVTATSQAAQTTHKSDDRDDGHRHKHPKRCDDDRKGENTGKCRPPSGKPKDDDR